MSKFKIGDRVKATDAEDWTYGLSGTVVETSDGGADVKFDDANGQGWGHGEGPGDMWFHTDNELELIEPEATEEPIDPEAAAIAASVKALKGLTLGEIERVLSYLQNRYTY